MARARRLGRTRTGTGRRLATLQAEVLGLKELTHVFKELPRKLQKVVLKESLQDAGAVMLTAQKRHAPHGATGNLAASLHVWPVVSGKRASRTAVGTTPEIFYAPWVEYGHAHAPAHPFMRPALDTAYRPSHAAFTETFREELPPAVRALAQQMNAI